MGELTVLLAHEIKQLHSCRCNQRKDLLPMAFLVMTLTCQRPAKPRRESSKMSFEHLTLSAAFQLAVSRRGAAQRELLDVIEIIHEMIVLLRNEASRYSISIRSELADDLPKAMADRVQLQQVFMNLMLNGIEAMKDDGWRTSAEIKSGQTEDGQLRIFEAGHGRGNPQRKSGPNLSMHTLRRRRKARAWGWRLRGSINEAHGGRVCGYGQL